MYEKLMLKAYELATHSPDNSTQCGAVILDSRRNEIIGKGFNHYPGGIEKILEKPEKYRRILHAERAAIYDAWECSRVDEAIMVAPWAACCNCALAIISVVAIKTLVIHGPRMALTPERWKDEIEYGLNMIKEARIEIITLENKIPDAPEILVNSILWKP